MGLNTVCTHVCTHKYHENQMTLRHHTHTYVYTQKEVWKLDTGFGWVLWKEGFLLCFERGQSWAQPEVEGECKVQSRKRANQCHALFSDIMLWWHLGPLGALALLILYNCLKLHWMGYCCILSSSHWPYCISSQSQSSGTLSGRTTMYSTSSSGLGERKYIL